MSMVHIICAASLGFSMNIASAETMPLARAVLTGSHGEEVKLSRYQGKPIIVFYEDRHSTQMNKPLKTKLFEWGKAHGLMDAANVIAIANLKAFNFFPAKGFALQHVRGVEQKVGIPILVDLDGTMNAPPWSLPPESSTVVVFDREGAIVYRKTGALGDLEIDRVISLIETLFAKS
jgi:Bacterial protein of unknown function (YtfJ_HI0045)